MEHNTSSKSFSISEAASPTTTSYDNSRLFAPGVSANTIMGSDWAFQGSVALEPVYEDNFEADINAIAESVGDDSGYYSNDTDSPKANSHEIASHGDQSPANVEIETAGIVHDVYTHAAASNKSNHGSIYEATLNKSTAYLEKGISRGKHPKETRMTKTLYHPVPEYERSPSHKYSSVEIEAGDQRPLEIWETTYERHEWIAYQLDQPPKDQSSKSRKSSIKK